MSYRSPISRKYDLAFTHSWHSKNFLSKIIIDTEVKVRMFTNLPPIHIAEDHLPSFY